MTGDVMGHTRILDARSSSDGRKGDFDVALSGGKPAMKSLRKAATVGVCLRSPLDLTKSVTAVSSSSFARIYCE